MWLKQEQVYDITFMHLADAFIQRDLEFRLFIFIVSMCVP